MPASVAARAHRALESLHSLVYFAPEAEDEYERVGLRPGGMPYFASRSAAMGAVAPGVTTATFYNFNPDLVARYLPRAWTLATPGAVLEARLVVVDRALRRLLGERVDSPEVAEAAELTRDAALDLPVAGRALFGGHAGLDWPDRPHLALWHGVTLLREFRGDAHIAALLASGLSGVEAVVSHTATGAGFTEPAAKRTRGWSDEQWDAAAAGLAERGLLGPGGLTEDGQRLRESIETATDAMDTRAWDTLGPDRTERLIELGKDLSRTVIAAGAFPPGVFARSR